MTGKQNDSLITIIIGPTAIGKSDYAIDLAAKTAAEIISADAFQVYRHMDIGTAKVSRAVRDRIPHHLIDIKSPLETYSVAEFLDLTRKLISEIKQRGKQVIICGGTGFYIHSFLCDAVFDDIGMSNPSVRVDLERMAQQHGGAYLWKRLYQIDPDRAKAIDKNNSRRVIRALEIYHITKKKPSQLMTPPSMRNDVRLIGLTAPRATIYDRIHRRVDTMLADGLIEEVRHLRAMKVPDNAQSLSALGYKETCLYLNGSLTKEEMIQLIKIRTRHFAKRQLTWFKRYENIQWLEVA